MQRVKFIVAAGVIAALMTTLLSGPPLGVLLGSLWLGCAGAALMFPEEY